MNLESREQRTARLAAQRAALAACRPDRIDSTQGYTLRQTAASLNISVPQVYKLIGEGTIKTIPGIRPKRVAGAEIIRITSAS